MGNQASKVIEKTKERKERRSKNNRRRSTITLGGRSHSSLVMAATKNMQANYDWIDEKQDPSLISNPPVTKSRRQSITEFFSARKKSLVQDDFKEYDRLQRQVKYHYIKRFVMILTSFFFLSGKALLVKECSQVKCMGCH